MTETRGIFQLLLFSPRRQRCPGVVVARIELDAIHEMAERTRRVSQFRLDPSQLVRGSGPQFLVGTLTDETEHPPRLAPFPRGGEMKCMIVEAAARRGSPRLRRAVAGFAAL